jgi:dTMP kinase
VQHPPLSFYGESLPGIDTTGLTGKLIAIEGPDAAGGTTQTEQLQLWLECEGHAVRRTQPGRSKLACKAIRRAREKKTAGPCAMALLQAADFADRLELEVIPALRAGFVVLADGYIFSMIAQATAQGENRKWIETVLGFALVPHAVYYLKAGVPCLVTRVLAGRGSFDDWENGMEVRLGHDPYESFVNYQAGIIKALDRMAEKHSFNIVDATPSADVVFDELQSSISGLFSQERIVGTPVAPPRLSGRQKRRS